MTHSARSMTPAEKYYTFLDRVSPMNLLLVADLDRALDIDEVAAGWSHFVQRRAVPRLQVHADLTIGDGGPGEVNFAGLVVPSAEWDACLSEESRRPFGTDRSMRCCYLASPDEQRSRLVFVVHHAVADGRLGVAELQAFVRALDGQPLPEQSQPPAAVPATRTLPWQHDNRELRRLILGIRERNNRAGRPEPRDWVRPGGPRVPRFFSLLLEGPQARGFLDAARRHRTKAYSAMAAAWLDVATRRLLGGTPSTLQLATPIDLREGGVDTDAPSAPVISVVANRFRVAPGSTWELAAEVAAALEASIGRGEGELLFHLTRAKQIDDLDAGARVLAHSLATAAPAFSVTNLGVVDPGTDPPWLRSMCGYLAPTPNQVIFVSGLGYRGRLVHSISTDDNQLDPEVAAALVTGYTDQIAAMAAPEGDS